MLSDMYLLFISFLGLENASVVLGNVILLVMGAKVAMDTAALDASAIFILADTFSAYVLSFSTLSLGPSFLVTSSVAVASAVAVGASTPWVALARAGFSRRRCCAGPCAFC